MKIIVQRVKNARVTNDTIDNQINKGYCLLVGVGQNSTEEDVKVIARKIAHARLFEDENDKLNLNIQQVEGEILSVSQFTIYACLLYTSPSPRDKRQSRMPSSA